VKISVIVRKKVHMDMFSILNGCGDVAIEINKLQVIHISILNVKIEENKLLRYLQCVNASSI
jgi:hypothetical protein